MKVRTSTLEKEGLYQAAKWLKFQVLVEGLETLFERLEPFEIFPLTGIVNGEPIAKELFLKTYREWVEGLKGGKVPDDRELRKMLAAVWTEDPESLWLQEIPGKGYLIKVCKAALHVQAHWFRYSPIDGVFRPMSMGEGSIFWGLQFSFPQIYRDGKTMEFQEVRENRLVKQMRLWLREKTRATPFLVEGKRVNVPIRLGKECFSWICRHPQLVDQGIAVHG